MSVSSDLTARLGLQHPIIQAPMAGVATPRLAAAVSNAGGLGSLGIGACTTVQARQMIEATRALTSRPFNVNVFCHRAARRDADRESAWLRHLAPLFSESGIDVPPSLDEIYKTFVGDHETFNMLLEQRPAVVSFHFGLPAAEHIDALRNAGIFTIASVTNDAEARVVEQAGVDAIVAQGIEAGGHRGTFDPDAADEGLSTAVLVRILAGQTKLPIIAAGGIMDGQGIKAALDLGAAAAQLGTAFILCPESAANENYRQNLKSARAKTTRLTTALSGRPARGMVNRLIAHGEAAGSPLPADYPVAYDAAKRLHAAAAKLGNHEFAAHWAGQGAPLARELPAGELVGTLVAELQRAGD
ncbi:2-nitropropane dioxygenase [Burkholderia lata]|uniref:NAD(P)H-dependent flavin oxidoreductase n=1 Tax=Burkholderia lata (strain ATCC 17760 / DSM 23089 / LMG 22485 / NCIMB 9086 / R18194 / 383) TaxID=482957 RepID=UPI000841D410|nr:nitronate monooxygenase [Burkholderia lata]AOJ42440.1 2-nitropropane dioxygenase [Burkholderia lata]